MHQELTFLGLLAAILVILVTTCTAAHSNVRFLELHGADGHKVFVNAHEISTLREPVDRDLNRYFARGTRCVVVTTNGKFIAVAETCASIRDRLR